MSFSSQETVGRSGGAAADREGPTGPKCVQCVRRSAVDLGRRGGGGGDGGNNRVGATHFTTPDVDDFH